jgi:hypothetical protein
MTFVLNCGDVDQEPPLAPEPLPAFEGGARGRARSALFGSGLEAAQSSGEVMKLAFAPLAAELKSFMSQIAMGHRAAFARAHRNHVDENFCP